MILNYDEYQDPLQRGTTLWAGVFDIPSQFLLIPAAYQPKHGGPYLDWLD